MSGDIRNSLHGSKWWKVDFHTHTPASHDYNSAGATVTPSDWLLAHMRAEIDCVVISDHNSGEWVDKLKIALEDLRQSGSAEFRELYLFPGVEISVADDIHLLAIFDPETTTADISTLLGAVGYSGTHGQTNSLAKYTVSESVKEIVERGGVAIPAHVDKQKGLFICKPTGLGLEQALQCPGLLAIEVTDPSFPKPGLYQQLQMALAEVIGSDSHSLADAGSKFTWVKMEVPNIEAMRLALHDGSDGIMANTGTDPNALSRFYLEKITVKQAVKCGNGRPLEVVFSPWLNALIGGRGSGKSAILHFLRGCFDQVADLPKETSEEYLRFMKQPNSRGEAGMLKGETIVSAEFHHSGRQLRIDWHPKGSTRTISQYNPSTQQWDLQPDAGDVRRRFPIRIFSQKQLFNLTEDPKYLLTLIDSELQETTKVQWQSDLDRFLDEYLDLKRKERSLDRKILELDSSVTELSDVDAKMAFFENPETIEVLNEYNGLISVESDIENIRTSTTETAESLARALNIENPDSQDDDLDQGSVNGQIEIENPTDYDNPLLSDLAQLTLGDEASTALLDKLANRDEIIGQASALTSQLSNWVQELDSALASTNWPAEALRIRSAYEALQSELSKLGGNSNDDYAQLSKRREYLRSRVRDREKEVNERTRLQKQSAKKLRDILAHHTWLRTMRSAVIDRWVANSSSNTVRAKLVPLGDSESAVESIRERLRRPGDEFAKDVWPSTVGERPQSLVGRVTLVGDGADPWMERAKVVDELINGRKTDGTPWADSRFSAHLDKLREETPEDLDRLMAWVPEDRIELKLVSQSGSEQVIASGSAGQRTSSMLALLLVTSDAPLIIDQPEDDLDTKHISNLIVDGMRRLKKQQQIIVVTHNPNIPVNGAAEQIIELNFVSGEIIVERSGALQRRDIREGLCEIMEGGQNALRNRYYRIAQALS